MRSSCAQLRVLAMLCPSAVRTTLSVQPMTTDRPSRPAGADAAGAAPDIKARRAMNRHRDMRIAIDGTRDGHAWRGSRGTLHVRVHCREIGRSDRQYAGYEYQRKRVRFNRYNARVGQAAHILVD